MKKIELDPQEQYRAHKRFHLKMNLTAASVLCPENVNTL